MDTANQPCTSDLSKASDWRHQVARLAAVIFIQGSWLVETVGDFQEWDALQAKALSANRRCRK